ncbi:tRNA1(Val) (adenine(37)-N6)-methyltransferase [Sulfitobacter sp. S190]|uniref:tRNA1(Val) (adenine(37)-N6)-methyltransferase n=1 Tax=Sulfitobacter sp. S190 TaxID=2867022 RepID=UPI0021A7878B|nr:methyltransferase [Sulfitobacter sp. S190]UWR23102.1 methyltransferase [Sulfitobacter sp. S190]
MTQSALTHDAFLGGKLHLWQRRDGYRAGVDAVLLAATVTATAGQSVLELGCGVGAASLCLGARVAGLDLIGVEREETYAALARRNGLNAVTCDFTQMPLDLRQRQFDHVLANPPYYRRDASVAARNTAREAALGEDTPLSDWVTTAARRLAPGGHAHFIHRAERLPEILGALPHDMGTINVLPIAPREGRKAELVILRARKSGRGDFTLHAPLVMHAGAAHQDGDKYTPRVRAVLRDGAPLTF